MTITERSVDSNLKTMLNLNEPFQYAHLVKFERPSRPDDSLGGRVSTAAERYVYLTDGSINITFDDGSTDLAGNSNGAQTYIANKVLDVGAVREQTKATATQTTLKLDGNALDAYLEATVTVTTVSAGVWDLTCYNDSRLDDFLTAGFREGDKIEITYFSETIAVNIHSFRGGDTVRVTKIDEDINTTGGQRTFTMASEEIISILLNKNDPEYASFINREVYIYRAYIQNGSIVGEPIHLFKGIIQNVSFDDDERSGITVTWGLTSHWGDFAAVRGRITSDESHRALDSSGRPQVASALKPVYAYDKGFIHAENSINLLAEFTVLVENIKVKSKSGFLGLFAKTKVKKELLPEDRYADLDFQLAAKAIPVVYGVGVVDGIPIFADVLNDDSSTVYVATVLAEGEIGGLYDLYIEDRSLVCIDEADYDARGEDVTRTSEASDAIDIFCRGRADRGDVLGGIEATDNTYTGVLYDGSSWNTGIINPDLANWLAANNVPGYTAPAAEDTVAASSSGIIDGETITISTPQEITVDVFTGKPGQKASAQLSQIALAENFKIQNDYWQGTDTAEYWGPNHRLIDTAYTVSKYKITEGETSLPEIRHVIRGKVIDCYNYDYSYSHDNKVVGESADNFPLGGLVSLYDDSDTLLNANIQIIDKWTFKNPDGTDNTRFRFSSIPSLNYDDETGLPSITRFYMSDGVNTWTMVTHNYELLSGAPGAQILTSYSSLSGSSGNPLVINYTSNSNIVYSNDPVEDTTKLMFVDSNGNRLSGLGFVSEGILLGTSISATSISTIYPYSGYSGYSTNMAGKYIASANTIKLPSSASATDDYYNGDLIRVTRIDSNGKSIEQVAEIIGYDGTNKIATISEIWTFIPGTSDSLVIYPKYADSRVSINPAIQTLDYVTSKTYGRGLDIAKDIHLPSWMETARKCDGKAKVSVGIASGTSSSGAIYRYPQTGNIIWQGTVEDYVNYGWGDVYTFTNVIGKLTSKWNSWKEFKLNELVYHEGNNYRVDSAGIKATAPTHTSGTIAGLTYIASLSIHKVSGTGDSSMSLYLADGNPVFNIEGNTKVSGYSTYDCDSIRYWRMCGWDEHAQRYATLYQTNISISPATSVFENVNTLLNHFNGIIRYTAGKYYLDLEEQQIDTIGSQDVRTITPDHIVGKIQLSDQGTRSSYNSLTASFADPAIKFEARNVSFFNSDYLKIDRNVPKKGNITIPGISNYYNARLLATTYLNKSRFGLTINMRVAYRGILLLAGTVIQVQYPRYNWDAPGKKFRIVSANYLSDCLVDIVAEEYDDSFYTENSVGGGVSSSATPGGVKPVDSIIAAPSNLQVTSADSLDELYNGVDLSWENNPAVLNNPNVYTEIYGGQSPNLYIYITDVNSASDEFTAYESLDPDTGAHDLVVGMRVFPEENYLNILDKHKPYYVVSTPGANTFKLSTTRDGTPIDITSTESDLNIKLRTAALINTVPVPVNTYSDNIPNEGSGSVEKYYWLRHKIIRIT